MDQIGDMLDLAVKLGARRIEIDTVQFHGWAERNRKALKTSAFVAEAASGWKEQSSSTTFRRSSFELPQGLHGGWRRTGLNVTPSGKVLPCHAAESIPSLQFETVRDRSVTDIWYDSSAFNNYRGDSWMPDLCNTCDRKAIDFGGCRCQAMALAGHPAATDPVCIRSLKRQALVEQAEIDSRAEPPDFVYRGR